MEETTLQILVAIYLIVAGELQKAGKGADLSNRSKFRLRKNLVIFRDVFRENEPDLFCLPPRSAAQLTLAELIKILGKSYSPLNYRELREIDTSIAKVRLPISAILKRIKQRSRFGLFSFGWKRLIRNDDWFLAGHDMMAPYRLAAEKALRNMARELARLKTDKHERSGIIIANRTVFNPVSFHNNQIPPLEPGDVIKYEFLVVGENEERIEPIRAVLLS